jgi:two-component system NtrC family sensor kinase
LKELLPTSVAAIVPLLTSFLASSKVTHLVLLDRDGRVRFASNALTDCLGTDASKMTGRDFRDFVTAPDSVMISRCLSGDDALPVDLILLNIVGQDQSPYSIRCRIALVDEGFLLLGEAPQDVNFSLQKELLQLNNRLSVLSRENVRKGRELAKALADLKKTQSMLVHQEKMASMGQMTAGIAHEINNPLAFVLGNEQVLKRDFADLLAFINTMRTILPEIESFSPRIHTEIISMAGEVGLEYLSEAVPRKIEANIEGLERVKRIVLDLRNFSRLDEAEEKYCHLAEGIESTIRFLGSLLQEHGVTIETDFARLPQLLCSPGSLNQAISNVLANAIQASKPGQTVRVSTHLDGEWYSIEVADNGIGIPAEHVTKVFDPFFTTKPVGSGTGLGLSIAHQIVAAHHGRIEIESLPGSGTTMRILLPHKQQSSVIDTNKIPDRNKETETDRD